MPRLGKKRRQQHAGATHSTKRQKHAIVTAGGGLAQALRCPGSGVKRCGVYLEHHKVLLVGEGDFSFAAALCTALGGENVVGTSFDSHAELMAKYGSDAQRSLSILRACGALVLHSVDATKLREHARIRELRFDRVVFQFPHAGGATKKDVEINRDLIRSFIRSASWLLADERAEVHVSLRSKPFYKSWGVELLGEGCASFIKTVSFPRSAYTKLGYREVRTNPAFRDAPDVEAAVTYVFRRKSVCTSAPAKLAAPVGQKQAKLLSRLAVDDVSAPTKGGNVLKRIKSLRKLLRNIEALKARSSLQPLQKVKLSREPALREELARLLSGMGGCSDAIR